MLTAAEQKALGVPPFIDIILLTYENYAEIPEKMHLFYAQAFDTLLQKHDATKGGFQRAFKTNLSSDKFKKIISKFCFITYYQNILKFTHDELVAFLKKSQSKDVDFSYDDMIDDLKDALCFIYKDGIHYFFTHRSFQEYFTAVFLNSLSDDNMKKMSLKLIENDTQRVSNDSTFAMLYDMSTELFEQNVLLPLLESIEKDDIADKYDFYFNFIKPEFIFEDEILFGWCVSDEYAVEFIKYFSSKYNQFDCDETSEEDKKLYYKKLYDYLVNNKKFENERYICYECIIKDKKIYELFKSTWIGESIKNIANLKDILIAKKKKNDLDLEELFTIE